MKHAELFAGYGGLGLAVEEVFGAELAWYAEFDAAPSKIMARHWPGVPNYGDVTAVDWSAVEPVDIISGGSPCQDVSAAGRRAGMTDGTRSNLWVAMREAIAQIRPRYVIWENVKGAHSATAYSAVESEPRLLGDDRAAYLRATGRVLGDLANLGYDAQWRTISAASVGAPHRRERVFLLAWRRDAVTEDGDGRRDGRGNDSPRESGGERADAPTIVTAGASGGSRTVEQVALLPTPMTVNRTSRKAQAGRDTAGPSRGGPSYGLEDVALMHLLPTPQANLASNGGSQHPDKRRAGGHSVSIADVVEHNLLPTPAVADVQGGRKHRSGHRSDELLLNGIAAYEKFGDYAPAIRRWEHVLGRPAPPPTELSPKGRHRLSPHFTEWMMGLPQGWITDTPGITRRDAIKAAGNGVVPQQAHAALVDMLDTFATDRGRAAT